MRKISCLTNRSSKVPQHDRTAGNQSGQQTQLISDAGGMLEKVLDFNQTLLP